MPRGVVPVPEGVSVPNVQSHRACTGGLRVTKTRHIRVSVNGQEYAGQVEPRLLLVDFLRDHLGLTGTHVGCEHGVC
jgi:hypothetical protein